MSEFTFWIWQRVLHLLEWQYLCYRIEEALFLPIPATLITNPVQTQLVFQLFTPPTPYYHAANTDPYQ